MSSYRWQPCGPGPRGAMCALAFSPHNPDHMIAGLDMGHAFMSWDGGDSWETLGENTGKLEGHSFGNPGYRGVWNAAFDPKDPAVIWIAGSRGLYKSIDAGETWRLVLGGNPIQLSPIAIDPADSNRVYVASGRSPQTYQRYGSGLFYRTEDGGRTWFTSEIEGAVLNEAPAGSRRTHFAPNWFKIVLDDDLIWLAGQGGLFLSQDNGRTWHARHQQLPGGPELQLTPTHKSAPICDLHLIEGALFATVYSRDDFGGVYITGDPWTPSNSGLEDRIDKMQKREDGYRWADAIIQPAPSQPDRIYWADGLHGIRRSDDRGQTWQNPLQGEHSRYFEVAPDFDGTEVRWELRRAGAYAKMESPGGGVYRLAVSPHDPDVVAYTTMGGLFMSRDGGQTWDEKTFAYGVRHKTAVHLHDIDRLTMGLGVPSRYTHTIRSTGIHLIVPTDLSVNPFNELEIAGSWNDVGAFVSRDGGRSWEWLWEGILDKDRHAHWPQGVVHWDTQHEGVLYVSSGRTDRMYRSGDGGRTFAIIDTPAPVSHLVQRDDGFIFIGTGRGVSLLGQYDLVPLGPDGPIHHLATNGESIYAINDAGLHRWEGGVTWTLLRETRWAKALAAYDTQLALVDNERVYHSRNGGADWTLVPDTYPASTCAFGPDGAFYVARRDWNVQTGVVGLFKSYDFGATRHRIDHGAAMTWEKGSAPYNKVLFHGDTIYALSTAGVWRGEA